MLQMPQPSAESVDIGGVLDHGPFTSMQKVVVMLAAFAIVMDGFDGQLIGFAIPALIQEWGITRNAFAPAVANVSRSASTSPPTLLHTVVVSCSRDLARTVSLPASMR